MSDPAPPDPALPPTSAAQESDPTAFVLRSELAEVQLLLDNLSTSPDKSLIKATAQAKEEGLPADWLERICRIRWPPGDSPVDQAEQAALLIKAKDLLVQQTQPATGANIVFTLLVTQEYDGGRVSWFTRLMNLLPWRLSEPQDEFTLSARMARVSLAREAYPGLIRRARRFRIWMQAMSFGMFAVLGATCALSWYVAFGNANLTQLANVTAAQVVAEKRVSDIENGDKSATSDTLPDGQADAQPVTTASSASAVPRKSRPSAGASKYVTALCQSAALIPPLKPLPGSGASAAPIRQFHDAAEMHACDAEERADADVARVRLSLTRWLGPLYALSGAQPTATEAPDAFASATATILGTAVLPVLYGVLGAGAAIIRLLSAKMKSSQLSPRDLSLSLQQLALGAVTGACIGLFVPAASSGAQDGASLLAPVRLSGSALSFVAGFGVESVFSALEGFIGRIFSVAPTEKANAGPKA